MHKLKNVENDHKGHLLRDTIHQREVELLTYARMPAPVFYRIFTTAAQKKMGYLSTPSVALHKGVEPAPPSCFYI